MHEDLPVYTSLDQLVLLVEQGDPVYVRWSRGPHADRLAGPGSKDELTGTQLPGLSANPLLPEAWWKDRPAELWVARRLYDYSHLRHDKGPGISPWVLLGEEAGRGPDNEPLVRHIRPVAWIASSVIADAEAEVARQKRRWGPMRRPHALSEEGASAAPDGNGTAPSGTAPAAAGPAAGAAADPAAHPAADPAAPERENRGEEGGRREGHREGQ